MRMVMGKLMRVTRMIMIVTGEAKTKSKMYLQVNINRHNLTSPEVTQTVPVKVQPRVIRKVMGTITTVQGPVPTRLLLKLTVQKVKSTKEATLTHKDS